MSPKVKNLSDKKKKKGSLHIYRNLDVITIFPLILGWYRLYCNTKELSFSNNPGVNVQLKSIKLRVLQWNKEPHWVYFGSIGPLGQSRTSI